MTGPIYGCRSIRRSLFAVAVLAACAGAGSDPPDPPPPPPPAPAAPAAPAGFELGGVAARAEASYLRLCSSCHGAQGRGDGAMGRFLDPRPKDLTDRDYMAGRSDYQIYLAIKEGGRAVGLSDKMAPWEKLLSDQEIRDLAAYVRTLAAR